MDTEDDEELRLVRASGALLSDLQSSLPKLLWKCRGVKSSTHTTVHRFARAEDLEYIVQLIEPFQGEPQLLDSKLKVFLPPLVDAYLAYLPLRSNKEHASNHVDMQSAVCKLLYMFCKVRGEKVTSGFLNNEPKYLEPVLAALEEVTNTENGSWQTSYVLMLWLSHLLLAPFDLSTVTDLASKQPMPDAINFSPNLPIVVRRIVNIGLKSIRSVTKEQEAAAKMLVRLVNRPDMQRLKLPQIMVSWACMTADGQNQDVVAGSDDRIGPLRFLAGMTVSPDTTELSDLIPSIYSVAIKLFEQLISDPLAASAVIKKQVLKMIRNIAILSLKPSQGGLQSFLESNDVLEDVIDMLLQTLSDRDTPVRFAASKAISMIVMRLDPELGQEIIQAVIDSLKEDLRFTGSAAGALQRPDFSMVNQLKWHGMILTLSHNLFRRTASPERLPEIINALLPALLFEQRATTGQSIGTNVRDAACFGLWALARRYTTKELLTVNVDTIPLSFKTENTITAIQLVAIQLLVSACLDPGGNVRRGCSAAFQELIGRHPDRVFDGISLVQIVDYQAVGLRRRAMVDIVRQAAGLHVDYWNALLSSLLDWRGIASPDILSREAAAASIGQLCADRDVRLWRPIVSVLREKMLSKRPIAIPVEEQHGCLLALSSIVDQQLHIRPLPSTVESLLEIWQIYSVSNPAFVNFTPRALKADLFPAIAHLIISMAKISTTANSKDPLTSEALHQITAIANALFSRSDETILNIIPDLVHALYTLHELTGTNTPPVDIEDLISQLEHDAQRTTVQGAARALAIGAVCREPVMANTIQTRIILALTSLRSATIVEWRIVGLQAIKILLPSLLEAPNNSPGCVEAILVATKDGLDDYTITERGDVGSLVRLTALEVVDDIWQSRTSDEELLDVLVAEVLRLSLEKLDRVRLAASRCLHAKDPAFTLQDTDVSSATYFKHRIEPLTSEDCAPWQREATIKGLISSAGTGNEAVLQAARQALSHTLTTTIVESLTLFMTTLLDILKAQVSTGLDTQPLLEFLAYLLDAVPTILEVAESFSWRNLLVYVQKAHFKSSIMPKILAAVDVYRGLARIHSIREEVLKKLLSMLKTNPYHRVRLAVAECLWTITEAEALKPVDWLKAPKEVSVPLQEVQKQVFTP